MRKVHWPHALNVAKPHGLCGAYYHGTQFTSDQGAITCGSCRRLLGLPPYKPTLPSKYRTLRKPSPKAIDSLIGRAFKETEGELSVALVEAEKALAESLKCKDPAEIIAELSGALRRLVDLLGGSGAQ